MAKFKKIDDEVSASPEASPASPPASPVITWGGIDHDLSRFAPSYRAMFEQRARERLLAHIQGNEVAAKVTAWKEKNKSASDEEIDAETMRLRQENLERMYAGTMSIRAPSAASASTVETIALELAGKDAFAKLHTKRVAAGLPSYWPQAKRKKAENPGISADEATVNFPGVGPMTRAMLAKAVFDKSPETYLDAAKVERQRRLELAKAKKGATAGVVAASEASDELGDLL